MSVFTNSSPEHEFKKIVLFIIFLLLMVLVFFQISELGWLEILSNQEKIKRVIEQAGLFGPIAIIVIIASAIIISPIPSAPIALVSGALMAFLIVRKLGYEYVSRKFHPHLPKKIMGSQNTLMLIIFLSRLVPFISFDVISYAAGLTNISFGRFFIATLLGIIPISFILAHLGSEMVIAESQSIAISVLILGVIMVVPLLINTLLKNKKSQD